MTTTTIYLAASFNQQERMRAFRDVLQSFNGIAVTSRWIDVHVNAGQGNTGRAR